MRSVLRLLTFLLGLPEPLLWMLTGGRKRAGGRSMDGPSQLFNTLFVRVARPIEERTPAQIRRMVAKAEMLRPAALEVSTIETFSISSSAASLRVRRYDPDRPSTSEADRAARPALVYFHGGGWVFGTLDQYDPLCAALAARLGFTVFSVDYRLAPEHRYPAAIDDACSGYLYIYEHAAELGVDPTRIAVGGDSAGGNLAAALCHRMQAKGLPMPAHQLLIYPATDLSTARPSQETFAEGFALTRAAMRHFKGLYVLNPASWRDVDASPLLAERFDAQPAATIVLAGFDPLVDEGLAYAERLREAGVPVYFDLVESTFHGFISFVGLLPVARVTLDHACTAMRSSMGAASGKAR